MHQKNLRSWCRKKNYAVKWVHSFATLFSVLWIFKTCCRSFSPNRSQITLLLLSIGQVRYTNILTWLRGFQKKFLDLVLFFFVFMSLKGIERQKKLKKITILTWKPRSHVGCDMLSVSLLLPLRNKWVLEVVRRASASFHRDRKHT